MIFFHQASGRASGEARIRLDVAYFFRYESNTSRAMRVPRCGAVWEFDRTPIRDDSPEMIFVRRTPKKRQVGNSEKARSGIGAPK